jgi:hypothetical protein
MLFGSIRMSIDFNHDGFANVILLSQDIYAIGGVEGGVPFNVLLLLLFLLIETILGPQFFCCYFHKLRKNIIHTPKLCVFDIVLDICF